MSIVDPNEGMGEDLITGEQLYQEGLDGGDQDVVEEELFQLNDTERESALWKKIDAFLFGQLMELRESNDYDHAPIATAEIRGKIELIKEFRGLGIEPGSGTDPDSLDEVQIY